PVGHTPFDVPYRNVGEFGFSGNLVVRVDKESGEINETPIDVRVDWSGRLSWDLDPDTNLNGTGASSVKLSAGRADPAEQTSWFDLKGGQPFEFDNHSWSSASDSKNGTATIKTKIGATFSIAVTGSGKSGAWVGGSGDFHGEVEAAMTA